MKGLDRLAVRRFIATWWLPTVIACAVGALYVFYSVAQWRALVAPSWDLGIFAEAVQAYSRFEAPVVPIKGPGYNLLGDHFHPILALLGPIFRLFPSALTLLVVQDLLIAASVLPIARLAQRLLGRGGALLVGLAYGLGGGCRARSAPSSTRSAWPSPCWRSEASPSLSGAGERAWRGWRPSFLLRRIWGSRSLSPDSRSPGAADAKDGLLSCGR